MRRVWTTVLVTAAVAGATVAVAAPAQAGPTDPRRPISSFSFTSDQGDYIGGGQTQSYVAPTATVTGRGTATSVGFGVTSGGHWWNVSVVAGVGDTLHPGQYVGAERAPFRTGRSPGLEVSGDGRGCNTLSGTFWVNQIAFDATGKLTMADIDVEQHCEGATPALHGSILYKALPLSYTQRSDTGDYIGGGRTLTYTGARSLLSLTGGASALTMSVSGLGTYLTGEFAAPRGTTFAVGTTYPTSRFGDATHAELDVFGSGRGCNTSTGTLTVRRLVIVGGTVTQAVVTFVQHCEGGKPALHGTLHYFA